MKIGKYLLAAALLSSCASSPMVKQENLKLYEARLSGEVAPSVLKAFDYNPELPLEAETKILSGYEIEVMVNRDLICEAVSFRSPLGDRVTGYLFRPKDVKNPIPGVLALSGSPGKAQAANAFAGVLARKGVAVLTIDALPYRRDREKTGQNWEQFHLETQIGQVVEFRRALDYLASRTEVNSQKLGVYGNSAGGFAGSALTGIESRVKAYLFQIAMPSRALFDIRIGKEFSADLLPYDGLPMTLKPRTAPILWQNQTGDPILKKEIVEEVIGLSGEPKQLRWYSGTHSTNPAMDQEGAQWLFDQLAS